MYFCSDALNIRGMDFNKYLAQEWVPALGCTEPAAIAYAGLVAALELKGTPEEVRLIVDPKIYKNCYSVGIPHSGHKTGLKWASAIGCFLKNSDAGLQCFRDINEEVLASAEGLINSNNIKISIDTSKTQLMIDFTVSNSQGSGRCLIEGTHTNIHLIERNGEAVFTGANQITKKDGQSATRKWVAGLSVSQLIKTAAGIDNDARKTLRDGAKLNIAIAEHGVQLFPKSFFDVAGSDSLTKISSRVCAGVYARMWGEDYPVMTVAGSGNKGIVLSVPLLMLEKEWGLPAAKIEEAMALAMLFTSKTTEELGTLSAVCGCSNAAGIGLSCAIVYLKGGGEKEISYAINNMVGNVTGMICDGAKIGCALKTMTAVDAAFRAATLALSGIGIPKEDGIVGRDGSESLTNMGRIANLGMVKTDEEILRIMSKKM